MLSTKTSITITCQKCLCPMTAELPAGTRIMTFECDNCGTSTQVEIAVEKREVGPSETKSQ